MIKYNYGISITAVIFTMRSSLPGLNQLLFISTFIYDSSKRTICSMDSPLALKGNCGVLEDRHKWHVFSITRISLDCLLHKLRYYILHQYTKGEMGHQSQTYL